MIVENDHLTMIRGIFKAIKRSEVILFINILKQVARPEKLKNFNIISL